MKRYIMFMDRKYQYCEDGILSQMIHMFPSKTLAGFFAGIGQVYDKFIWRSNGLLSSQNNLRTNGQVLRFPVSKLTTKL